jgi:hypothetical protein
MLDPVWNNMSHGNVAKCFLLTQDLCSGIYTAYRSDKLLRKITRWRSSNCCFSEAVFGVNLWFIFCELSPFLWTERCNSFRHFSLILINIIILMASAYFLRFYHECFHPRFVVGCAAPIGNVNNILMFLFYDILLAITQCTVYLWLSSIITKHLLMLLQQIKCYCNPINRFIFPSAHIKKHKDIFGVLAN